MLEAERQFRRVTGYQDLAKLAVAVEREVTPSPSRSMREAKTLTSAQARTRTATEVPFRPRTSPRARAARVNLALG